MLVVADLCTLYQISSLARSVLITVAKPTIAGEVLAQPVVEPGINRSQASVRICLARGHGSTLLFAFDLAVALSGVEGERTR